MAKKAKHEGLIEKVIEAPSEILDKTVETSVEAVESMGKNVNMQKAKEYWHTLGPGLTTGAADDDPSGIATYSQTGAQYGFQLLWLAGFTFPLMAVVQEMCARMGLVTGRGLAANIRLHYPKWVLYLCTSLLFFANTLNIGADLGAMAKATQLLVPALGFGLLVAFFGLIGALLQIYSSYERYAKYLKYLAMILLSYVLSALMVKLDWAEVMKHAVLPALTFSKDQIILICGILGTTISPYLFFWQTSQEVEEEILEGKTTVKLRQSETSDQEVKNMRTDVWSGMFFSNIVMFFIIAACAATLFASGVTNIASAADAAAALRPIAGDNAYFLFALGIIGTGMLAIPVLAGSSSYALAESFRWKLGLYRKLKEAYAFYGVIIISTIIGIILNFVGLDPMKVLIYSAVINGIISPVVLLLIVKISSDKKVMGKRANHPIIKAIGWITVILMSIVGAAAIISIFA